MQEVSPDVKLLNFVKTSNTFVPRLATNGVPLQHTHVQIGSNDARAKVLKRESDTSCANEGLINEISSLNVGLVRHHESKLVIGGGGSQVRSLLERELAVESVIVLPFATLLAFLKCGYDTATVHVVVLDVLDDLNGQLGLVKADIFIVQGKHFELFNDRDLLLDLDLAPDTLNCELEL